MLLSLKVKNYALIEELHVEFHNRLNIITGETGAGKSILLGALGLILGKRADLGVLSNKEKKCVVEADFDVQGYNIKGLFEENEVDYEQHTVIRREILSSGKSRAFVNDTPVTLGKLQEIALQLVDIHSQHQNLLLNQKGYLLEVIDRYANTENKLSRVSKLYYQFKEKERNFSEQKENFESIQREYEFISHQFNELEEAKLRAGELQDLEKELDELENLGDIKTAMADTLSIINAEESGVLDQLLTIKQKISKVTGVYSKGAEFLQRIDSVAIEMKDIQDEISRNFEGLEFDPDRFEEVKKRVDLLNSLLQKYKLPTIEALIELKEKLREKVGVAVDGEYELEKLKKELEGKRAELLKVSQDLSEKRISSFSGFTRAVEKYMKNLGLEHSKLRIEHHVQDLSSTGIDVINFTFSANKNHPLQDVSKIASGGEISRLMLAVKSVMSRSSGMPTLILDEIDTGVSGEIANKVGNILKEVSEGIQIINITHLPQVASKGKCHFLVYKDHKHEITRTLIKKLDETERVREIAKMLSGDELSEAALENAKVLLSI